MLKEEILRAALRGGRILEELLQLYESDDLYLRASSGSYLRCSGQMLPRPGKEGVTIKASRREGAERGMQYRMERACMHYTSAHDTKNPKAKRAENSSDAYRLLVLTCRLVGFLGLTPFNNITPPTQRQLRRRKRDEMQRCQSTERERFFSSNQP